MTSASISKDAILLVLTEEYGHQKQLSENGEPYERARADVALKILTDAKAAMNRTMELHEILGHLELLKDKHEDRSGSTTADMHNNSVERAVKALVKRFKNLIYGAQCMP